MKTVIIYRFWKDLNQTLGNCTVLNDDLKPLFSSLSLERGWRDNQARVSCLPLGEYKLKLEFSHKFQMDLWEIKGTEPRTECKFHSANYWYQLNGCIALGRNLADINRDGYSDITSSRSTMRAFHKAFGNDKEAILIIKD
jgi:hypothetical protein